MCQEPATADDVHAAMPHPVAGSAADPIALEPVDDVVVTTLVDNVYDALLTGPRRERARPGTGHRDRLRPRRRRQHRPARTAADRYPPAACTARRPAPGRRLLYPQHRPHGPGAHRTGTRPTGTRTLHRLAGPTRPRRRATRQLDPKQQWHPLPAHRLLTSPVTGPGPSGTWPAGRSSSTSPGTTAPCRTAPSAIGARRIRTRKQDQEVT